MIEAIIHGGIAVITKPATIVSKIAIVGSYALEATLRTRIQSRPCAALTIITARWRKLADEYPIVNATAAWPETTRYESPSARWASGRVCSTSLTVPLARSARYVGSSRAEGSATSVTRTFVWNASTIGPRARSGTASLPTVTSRCTCQSDGTGIRKPEGWSTRINDTAGQTATDVVAAADRLRLS